MRKKLQQLYDEESIRYANDEDKAKHLNLIYIKDYINTNFVGFISQEETEELASMIFSSINNKVNAKGITTNLLILMHLAEYCKIELN